MKANLVWRLTLAGVAMLTLAVLTGGGTVKEFKDFYNGAYGYEYGFPLVMMDLTKAVMTATNQSGEYKAPVNQFGRMRTYVSPDFKDCVRISVNSVWSFSFLDLDREPLVVTIPECKDRYIVVQALNMWTDNFGVAGTRNGAGKAGKYLVVGPKWNGSTPGDVTDVWRCSTRYASVLVQMAAASAADFPAIHKLQDQLQIIPLSAWGKPYTSPADVPVGPDVDVTVTPFDQLGAMDGVTFFRALAQSLKDNPPYPADAKMLKKLKTLGVEPGKDFEVARVSPAMKKGMDKESNWLPIPRRGPFNLTMRVYQPKKEIMDGKATDHLIVEPSVFRIPPVKKVG